MNLNLEKKLIAMSFVFKKLNFPKRLFFHTSSNSHYLSLELILLHTVNHGCSIYSWISPQTDKNISKFIKSTTAIIISTKNKSFEQLGIFMLWIYINRSDRNSRSRTLGIGQLFLIWKSLDPSKNRSTVSSSIHRPWVRKLGVKLSL